MATFNIQTTIFIILPPNKIHKRVTNVLTFHIFSSFMLHNLLAYLYFNLPDSAPLIKHRLYYQYWPVEVALTPFPQAPVTSSGGGWISYLMLCSSRTQCQAGDRWSSERSYLRTFKLSFREYFHRKFTDISLVHWGIWLKRQMSTAWKGTELQMGELRE